MYSNLLKRHGNKIFYFLKGPIKQSCIKFRNFLFMASMAGSELVWLASGYSQGVDNGLLDKVSMVQISLATS